MKIYKVRAWVNTKPTKRQTFLEHAYRFEEVIIDNLETAKRIFHLQKTEVKTYEGNSRYHSGYCELFEPHVFDGGTLAYWPDNDNYIEKYKF